MSVLKIVSRYATSLYDLAKAENKVEQVYQNMLSVWEVAKNEEFSDFLKSPIIPLNKKKDVFKAVFGEKVEPFVLNTIFIMAEHKREAYIKDFCRAFILKYNKAKGISIVCLTTVAPLTEPTVNALLEKFKAKGLIAQTVELETKLDPSLIGGFVLEFDDQVYDASLAYKLDQMKKNFSENLYIKNL